MGTYVQCILVVESNNKLNKTNYVHPYIQKYTNPLKANTMYKNAFSLVLVSIVIKSWESACYFSNKF